MRDDSPSQLSNTSLRQAMPQVVAAERRSCAVAIAHIAEYEARDLYLEDGYPTMQVYCVAVLGYSEDAAWRRVKAAEVSRKFPAILSMLADGRLHLTAVTMLSPFLSSKNAEELLALASRKNKKAIEMLLAERFPRPDLPTRLEPISASPTLCTVAPARNESTEPSIPVAPARNDAPPAKLAPRAPERFGLQVTIDQTTHDMLRHAQDLLSHQVPNGDLATVLRHVLEAALPQLEKRKIGTTRQPRTSSQPRGRHIPMHVRNVVWRRDGGRCTYVAENGHRCESRKFLEFDHETPFARGGPATVTNIRLRCRAHNQYEAQREFGTAFMECRRESAANSRGGG